MTAIALETVVSRAEGFTTAPVRDELMMLNIEQGAYYSLDPIAAEIWGMLEQPSRVQGLMMPSRSVMPSSPRSARPMSWHSWASCSRTA